MFTVSLLGAALVSAMLAPGDENAEVIAAQRPFYPLDTCVVSGDLLDSGDSGTATKPAVPGEAQTGPTEVVIGGRLYRLCSSKCAKTVAAQPKRYSGLLDEAVAQAQLPDYPLRTCPLRDEPLPASHKLVVIESRLVKLCCEKCVYSLRIDPTPAFSALDKAHIAAQQGSYPLKTCPITGKALGNRPHRLMFGNQLVQFCCAGCVRKFEAAPHKTLKQIAAALPERKAGGKTEPLKHGTIQGLNRFSEDDPPPGRGRGGR